MRLFFKARPQPQKISGVESGMIVLERRMKMVEQQRELSAESKRLVDHLKSKITEQQEGFKLRRNRNRNSSIRIKLSLIILSAVVTVLLGLKFEGFSDMLVNVAFVISAIVTALSAVEEFFEYRGLWIRYNITFTQLKSLQSDLEYLVLREKDESKMQQKLDEINERLKNILESTNSDWLSLRKKDVEK